MSGFWKSELGDLSGKPEDAFARSFRQIPDNTYALAKIESFKNESFGENKYLNINWLIIDGDFKGQHVFQKLHVFDGDQKKRHRSLNMLMLVYKMFHVEPKEDAPPSDMDLQQFLSKVAGIRVQETLPNDEGKQYNWVSEIHAPAGFKCETGVTKVVTHSVDSALSRNAHLKSGIGIDDELPF